MGLTFGERHTPDTVCLKLLAVVLPVTRNSTVSASSAEIGNQENGECPLID